MPTASAQRITSILLCALGLAVCFLGSCGGPQSYPVSVGTATVPVQTSSGRTDYTAFGDSITCGFVAAGSTTGPPFSIGDASCHTANAYPSYIASSLNLPLHNYGIPADQACDIWVRQIAPQTVSPSTATAPLYTVLIGTNDAGIKGTGPYEQNFRACSLATLSWLALPLSSKVLPTAVSANSGWTVGTATTLGAFAAAGKPGAALAFSITTSGGPIYLWHTVSDADAGTASVALDGVVVDTFSTSPPVPIATQNGTVNSVVAERITGVAAGRHTVVITDTAGDVAVLGLGTPPASLPAGHPIVLAGAVPSPLQGVGDYLRAPDAVYSADTSAIAAMLLADGLDIRFAPNDTYMTGAPAEMTDIAHVSPLGATHLAEAFLATGP